MQLLIWKCFQVRSKIARALRMLKMNCQSAERCSFEQHNCSFGGAPSEKQSCWSSTGALNELSKCRNSPWAVQLLMRMRFTWKQSSWSSAIAQHEFVQHRKKVSFEQCNCSLAYVPGAKQSCWRSAHVQNELSSAIGCFFEQRQCSFGGVPCDKQNCLSSRRVQKSLPKHSMIALEAIQLLHWGCSKWETKLLERCKWSKYVGNEHREAPVSNATPHVEGVTREKQSLWRSANIQNELSEHTKMRLWAMQPLMRRCSKWEAWLLEHCKCSKWFVKAQKDSFSSNANAHSEVFPVINIIAGAVHVLNMSGPSNGRCPLEQCNGSLWRRSNWCTGLLEQCKSPN